MTPVQSQGDGVKSFIGLMLALVSAQYPVIVVDEPEAIEGDRHHRDPALRARVRAECVREALEEAFADEWNFRAEPFERWKERRVNSPDFDPALWWIAWDGPELSSTAWHSSRANPSASRQLRRRVP